MSPLSAPKRTSTGRSKFMGSRPHIRRISALISSSLPRCWQSGVWSWVFRPDQTFCFFGFLRHNSPQRFDFLDLFFRCGFRLRGSLLLCGRFRRGFLSSFPSLRFLHNFLSRGVCGFSLCFLGRFFSWQRRVWNREIISRSNAAGHITADFLDSFFFTTAITGGIGDM